MGKIILSIGIICSLIAICYAFPCASNQYLDPLQNICYNCDSSRISLPSSLGQGSCICPANKYGPPDNSVCSPCPYGKKSIPGSKLISDCVNNSNILGFTFTLLLLLVI